MNLPARFWDKVDKRGPLAKHSLTGKPIGRCWLWLGRSIVDGYGRFSVGSRTDGTRRKVLAHRLAYEDRFGTIVKPQLDHLCRRRDCVNPKHLEPVTNGQNIARGLAGAWQRARTHCPSGHVYDEKNTYRTRDNRRMCRSCARAATQRWYANRKGKR